jgi:class 3 adenylate cyclase
MIEADFKDCLNMSNDMNLKGLTGRDDIVVIVGFFDLMGFAKWSEGRPPRDLLDLATALFKRTGRTIADAGGRLVKVIGDGGMFVFPADNPDRAVLSLQAMKRDCDAWLSKRGYPDVMVVKVQLGPVACGQVGPPGDERFDVYGLTVNRAAMMRGRSFTLGASLVDRLRDETRQGLTRSYDDEFVAADQILNGGQTGTATSPSDRAHR